MKKFVYPFICRWVVSILFFLAITAQTVQANNSLSGTPLDTRTLAMINKPGVVLVQTVWTADITLYEFSFIDEFEEDIADEIYYLVTSGSIPNTQEAMYSTMVQLMIENMWYYYFNTGNTYMETASTAAVGTGFIVTPDGYLITNAHVVNTNEDELYRNFVMSALENYAIEGTNTFVADMRSMGYQMSQQEIDGMLNAFYDLLAANIEINNLQTSYQCYLGNMSSSSDVSAKGVALDLRKMGEPIPGKDVAILKLDKANLPTVTLGDDSKLRTGDRVYAMGYPAVATLDDALNISQAIQEPTLTSGIVSARKEMAGGWNVIQTDAAIHGGNSGGPLFNEAGEVIGINTFGMIDPGSGAQVAGMNFAVPISIATQFLNEINVTPSQSSFTSEYKEAISLFQAQNYRQSLEILRRLNETNPGIPVVVELLAECSPLANEQVKQEEIAAVEAAKIQQNEVKKGAENKNVFMIIGLVAIGIIVVAGVSVVIIMSTRRKKQPKQLQANKEPSVSTTTDVNMDTRNCTQCGKTVPLEAKFCSSCGYSFPTEVAIPHQCTKCNQPLQPGAMFCSGCGAKIDEV